MKIADNCVVSIHYTLTDDQGTQIDSSAGQEPLVYLHGNHGIIPGLEGALVGKTSGDQLQVTVQPDQGYGNVNPDLIQKVPKSAFQEVGELQPGMQFQSQTPDGQVQRVSIVSVSETEVEVDGNHPLAGQVLNFDVTVESVREATAEEISHGHAH